MPVALTHDSTAKCTQLEVQALFPLKDHTTPLTAYCWTPPHLGQRQANSDLPPGCTPEAYVNVEGMEPFPETPLSQLSMNQQLVTTLDDANLESKGTLDPE